MLPIRLFVVAASVLLSGFLTVPASADPASSSAFRGKGHTRVEWDDYAYPRLYLRPGEAHTFKGDLFYRFKSQKGRVVTLQQRPVGATRWAVAGRATAKKSGTFRITWTAPGQPGRFQLRLTVKKWAGQPGGHTEELQQVAVEGLVESDPLADALAEEINQRRATGGTCGGDWVVPSAPAYLRDARLDSAAQKWATRIAGEHLPLSHISPEGEGVDERVEAEQYDWWTVGENIGTFYGTAAEAVDQWFGDYGHCDLVMSADYTEFGVGHGYDAGSEYGHYWVLVAATPYE
jgi:uncharacterized protein YkwD